MKKLIYLVVMAATFSLATSCKDKEKISSDDDIDDITYVISADNLA
ncbi:MAG: hypothetical protein IPI65_06295 [Bacteroidetes bacterium]|nr:hypothetical protein [Bacteroidota bacterium]